MYTTAIGALVLWALSRCVSVLITALSNPMSVLRNLRVIVWTARMVPRAVQVGMLGRELYNYMRVYVYVYIMYMTLCVYFVSTCVCQGGTFLEL